MSGGGISYKILISTYHWLAIAKLAALLSFSPARVWAEPWFELNTTIDCGCTGNLTTDLLRINCRRVVDAFDCDSKQESRHSMKDMSAAEHGFVLAGPAVLVVSVLYQPSLNC